MKRRSVPLKIRLSRIRQKFRDKKYSFGLKRPYKKLVEKYLQKRPTLEVMDSFLKELNQISGRYVISSGRSTRSAELYVGYLTVGKINTHFLLRLYDKGPTSFAKSNIKSISKQRNLPIKEAANIFLNRIKELKSKLNVQIRVLSLECSPFVNPSKAEMAADVRHDLVNRFHSIYEPRLAEVQELIEEIIKNGRI